jgi:hypothetical protein
LSLSILRTLGAIDVSVTESRTDPDFHADQCAIGSNLLVIHDFDRPINVTGYDPNGPVNSNLHRVSAALAYEDALTGESVIWSSIKLFSSVPDLSPNLLLTMQLRLNDVTVNDVPRFLTDTPTPLKHTRVILTDDFDNPYVIPMSLHGVASSFPTRQSTVEEYESLPHLVLTSEEPAYNPHNDSMARH